VGLQIGCIDHDLIRLAGGFCGLDKDSPGLHRSTLLKVPIGLPDEARLTENIIALAEECGRYGYRVVAGMLYNSGWHMHHERAEQIW
jgi:hypothetical protein